MARDKADIEILCAAKGTAAGLGQELEAIRQHRGIGHRQAVGDRQASRGQVCPQIVPLAGSLLLPLAIIKTELPAGGEAAQAQAEICKGGSAKIGEIDDARKRHIFIENCGDLIATEGQAAHGEGIFNGSRLGGIGGPAGRNVVIASLVCRGREVAAEAAIGSGAGLQLDSAIGGGVAQADQHLLIAQGAAGGAGKARQIIQETTELNALTGIGTI